VDSTFAENALERDFQHSARRRRRYGAAIFIEALATGSAMSSISSVPGNIQNNIQTNLLSPLSDATPASPPPPSYTPIWMVNDGASVHSLEMLGMRLPSAAGDLAVLIAQASLTLDQTSDKARNNATIAGLAGLAAALATFDIASLQATAARKQTLVDDATTDQTNLSTDLAPLQAQRDTLDSAVTTDQQNVTADQQSIASINSQIAALDTKASDYQTKLAGLQGQLQTAQGKLDTDTAQLHADRVSRSQVDVKLAKANIKNLDDQIAHVTAELQNAPADSDEATSLQTTLDQLNQQRTDADTRLTIFQTSAQTDAQLDAFSNDVQLDIVATNAELTARISGYQADVKTVTDSINGLTLVALALAAQTTASFASGETRKATHHASLDSNLDRAFTELGQELRQLDARLTQQRLDADDNQRDDLRRIEQLGQGLVAGIAGIVSALAQLGAEAQSDPSSGPAAAGRVKLNI
jgi:chromosome segregation ATPase